MSFISTHAAFDYADLPLATYRAAKAVLVTGSNTRRLLFCKDGGVAVVRRGTEIASVNTPGAVFGEISALLNKPHTADVYALKPSQLYVADAAPLRYIPQL